MWLEANVNSDFELDDQRKQIVEEKVATWAFSAHELTDDELLYAALVMLEHALSSPELSQWQLTEGSWSRFNLNFLTNLSRR